MPARASQVLAQVSRVQVPQVPVAAEQLLAPVPAARLLALVPGSAQVPAPEEASALVRVPAPGLQPSVALARGRASRLCAHT